MARDVGLDRARNDPGALSVIGRLLKDRAVAAAGKERRELYRESAAAYARAAKIGGATYPLINAASLSLLAGNRAESQKLARRLLARPDDELETPYWRGATRAEAYLLLGETARARTALTEAVARAPQAYEDHASTLRQFGLILDTRKEDKSWLDALRPPRALHFAGNIGLRAAGPDKRIAELIAKERIGFGYGALAAGADLLIAQALIEAGAELHVFLPGPADAFRKISVARYGRSWARRFDEILPKAARVHVAGEDADSPLGIRLAAEVAMGSAVMQAENLMTEALQLLILAGEAGRQSASNAIGAIWKRGKHRQFVLPADGRRTAGKQSRRGEDHRADHLAALLHIETRDQLSTALPRIAKFLRAQEAVVVPPRWNGEAVVAAFRSPDIAARVALSIADAFSGRGSLRIAAHYAVAPEVGDPFGGVPFLSGPSTGVVARIMRSTPDGAAHISENFAAALRAGSSAGAPRTEYVGELPDETGREPMKLFALKR